MSPRTVVRGVGEVLITLGVIVGLFVVYELFVTNIYTERAQHRLRAELTQAWRDKNPTTAGQQPGRSGEPVRLDPGDGFAVLYIPRLGDDYAKVVVEGVAHSDLKNGPGHYPGTALPGEVGNMVISGHRTTYGAPFNQLDKLDPGDPIVLQTIDGWFVYRTTGSQVVQPDDIGVTLPVPNRPGAKATQALVTLTTCNPKYSARQRLVVTGVLTQRLPSDRPPSAVGG